MRHGFTTEDIHAIHSVYAAFFSKNADEGMTAADRLKAVRKEVKNNKYAMDAIDFIENRSQRGVSAKQ
jgi:acyl-[acyl carrier protein]--UDP-N-acetylglucosamine O-acyltransferase